MAHLIEKDALVAELERRIKETESMQPKFDQFWAGQISAFKGVLKILDTLEVKEVDLELITGWFDHITQIADDRMTLTGQRMTDAHALDEIKCLAKNSSEFITKHYKAQKGE